MSSPSHPTSTSPAPPERPLPPAVRNGILPLERLPPVRPLPDDPATRDARYLRAAAMLDEWARHLHWIDSKGSLAAQALLTGATVVTDNPRHLARLVAVARWQDVR